MQQVPCIVHELDTLKLIFTPNQPANGPFSYDTKLLPAISTALWGEPSLYGKSCVHPSSSCNVLVPAHYKKGISMWLEQKIADPNVRHTFSPTWLARSHLSAATLSAARKTNIAHGNSTVNNINCWFEHWPMPCNITTSYARANSLASKLTIPDDFSAIRQFHSFTVR